MISNLRPRKLTQEPAKRTVPAIKSQKGVFPLPRGRGVYQPLETPLIHLESHVSIEVLGCQHDVISTFAEYCAPGMG